MNPVRPQDLAAVEVFADIATEQLTALADHLKPLHAVAGEVLMRQGDRGESFAIITAGRVEVRHVGRDGQRSVTELSPPLIVGEIALLRHTMRTATVIAKDDVCGYVGYNDAFEAMLAIPAIAERMVRTARQRLAAYVAPIPVSVEDHPDLLLRPVLPGDAERFQSSGTFSRETLYRRFMSSYQLTDARLVYLFEVDYVDHFVWVMTDGADGPVVAVGRFVRDNDDPALAEVALSVGDAYQRRGIGTMLLTALAIAARTDGIDRFRALVLADNEAARALVRKLHPCWEREDPGVVTTTVQIPALEDLPLDEVLRKQILNVAYQVIHAFD
ncbi:GNAT family N-acetyltransferase [Mycobacterium gastri]|uniref:Acetyltransferase n=1 Tax=Mycobacterium gastri TaxID=1777 RepID=A0A1X1UZV6_MYCGS|nr:GNAT family N-acetyltransferase [Mycobacterium gastri]ORV62228.1 acetyltransferase [Mycobacterium gastri]